MKLYRHFGLIIILIFLVSCTSLESLSQAPSKTNQLNSSSQIATVDKNFKIAMGQTIYVPVYSYIYHEDRQNILNLAATLSIHNTDLNQSIIITSVDYYDSDGKLIKQYLTSPIQLKSLASTNFFIPRNDNSGGVGANFIVEWIADRLVSEPIIEAVMIATESQQGVSFVSSGKVIKSRENK